MGLQLIDDFPKNEIEFDERFASEESCREYLYHIRWPDGFVCTRCQCNTCWSSNRDLYICASCEHQHSLTAGSISCMARRKL